MSLQIIPHDTTKYRNNPIELLNISNRNRIGSEYALSANTKLLITGIGNNNSTSIVDAKGKTVTRYGDTKISTAQSIIGGSSIYFDGTGDYLNIPTSSDFTWAGDFTIDFWWRTPAADGNYTFVEHADDTTSTSKFLRFCRETGIWIVYLGASGAINFSESLSYNSWLHVAVVRAGTTVTLFLNGISKASGTNSGTAETGANGLNIGTMWAETQSFVSGYLSYFRITKDKALWASNFTPPKYLSNNYIGD